MMDPVTLADLAWKRDLVAKRVIRMECQLEGIAHEISEIHKRRAIIKSDLVLTKIDLKSKDQFIERNSK